jgi:hypothetical protein
VFVEAEPTPRDEIIAVAGVSVVCYTLPALVRAWLMISTCEL